MLRLLHKKVMRIKWNDSKHLKNELAKSNIHPKGGSNPNHPQRLSLVWKSVTNPPSSCWRDDREVWPQLPFKPLRSPCSLFLTVPPYHTRKEKESEVWYILFKKFAAKKKKKNALFILSLAVTLKVLCTLFFIFSSEREQKGSEVNYSTPLII